MKTKTEMIKSKFSNQIHKLLNPNPVPNRERWKHKKIELTQEEKANLYDEIVRLDSEISNELRSYWWDRKFKRKVQKLREEKLKNNLAEQKS
jgi:hypothetical protein